MNIILAIISAVILLIGFCTFAEAAHDAAEKKDYESLQISIIMIVIGAFLVTFFLFGITQAVGAMFMSGILVCVAYFVISYCTGGYSFSTGKMISNDGASGGSDVDVAAQIDGAE